MCHRADALAKSGEGTGGHFEELKGLASTFVSSSYLSRRVVGYAQSQRVAKVAATAQVAFIGPALKEPPESARQAMTRMTRSCPAILTAACALTSWQ